ncbi:MAG: Hsp20/alpha crystallin family protein [Cyclobacteriaceae bacterium]
MALSKIHHGPFSRIGNTYGHFIDTDHFMGRDACADTWIAPTNASRKKDAYTVEVLLPGFSKDDVAISIEDDILEIKAERKDDPDRDYLTREIPTSNVERRFTLPKTVDSDTIKASLENGILTVRFSEKPLLGAKKVEIQ